MLISLFMENGSVFVERQDSNTMFRVTTTEWQVEFHMPHELAATLLSHHKAVGWAPSAISLHLANTQKAEQDLAVIKARCLHEYTYASDGALICKICNEVIAP